MKTSVKLIKRFDYFGETHWFHKTFDLPCTPWEGMTLYIGPSEVQPYEYEKDIIEEVFFRELDDALICRMKTVQCGEGMGSLEGWVKHFRDHGWILTEDQAVDPHAKNFLNKRKSLPRKKAKRSKGVAKPLVIKKKRAGSVKNTRRK